jgi:hypothetical protein
MVQSMSANIEEEIISTILYNCHNKQGAAVPSILKTK